MPLLTLTHRPHRFADVVGQDAARAILQALVHQHDVPAALLFTGMSGTGKTTAARIFAAALNCAEPSNGDCCGTCPSCRATQDGQHPSVYEIDAASYGGVDDVRTLQQMVQFSSWGQWRIVLLDEAHAMSRSAFNALLKTLEEPPPATTFVLLTTEPEKILTTVRSRAMPINFRPVSVTAIAQRLTTITASLDTPCNEEMLREIAVIADGGVRDAIMLLDQCLRADITTLDQLHTLTGRTDHPARILQALITNDPRAARDHLADYLVTHADLAELITGMIADLQHRYRQHSLDPKVMIAATKLLWDGRTIPGSPARTARTQIEALITLLSAVLANPVSGPVRPVEATPAPAATQPRAQPDPEPEAEPEQVQQVTPILRPEPLEDSARLSLEDLLAQAARH